MINLNNPSVIKKLVNIFVEEGYEVLTIAIKIAFPKREALAMKVVAKAIREETYDG